MIQKYKKITNFNHFNHLFNLNYCSIFILNKRYINNACRPFLALVSNNLNNDKDKNNDDRNNVTLIY